MLKPIGPEKQKILYHQASCLWESG